MVFKQYEEQINQIIKRESNKLKMIKDKII